MEEANELHEQISHQREGTIDAAILKEISEIVHHRVKKIATVVEVIDTRNFMSALNRKFRHEEGGFDIRKVGVECGALIR